MDREFSAGGVVYRKSTINHQSLTIKWLVTKSAPSKATVKSVWRLPKGWIDEKHDGKVPGPSASGRKRATEKEIQAAALKEVEEEGGVRAKIIKKIGTTKYFFTFENRKILKFVTFYLMQYLSDLAQGFGEETEEIEWLGYKEAREKLSYSGEKKILDQAKELSRVKK